MVFVLQYSPHEDTESDLWGTLVNVFCFMDEATRETYFPSPIEVYARYADKTSEAVREALCNEQCTTTVYHTVDLWYTVKTMTPRMADMFLKTSLIPVDLVQTFERGTK